MAGKRTTLEDMASAPAEAVPDLWGPEEAPHIEHRPPMLPQPCPVAPLGVLGSQIVFLDGLHQIQVSNAECQKGVLKVWFGNDYLMTHYEELGKGGNPTGKFNQDKVQTDLIQDCRTKGIFNPQGKVMGRGAHRPRADEGVLVLHTGRRVLIARQGQKKLQPELPGMVRIADQDLFFPADDALPPPADKPAERAEAEALLQLFGKWRWAEPGAPLLLLGWVTQAFICGALDWRAHVWLPGPTASGKSSLQKIIRAVLAEWVLSTADASEASIRQMLKNDTLPVSIDEAEKHDNPERLQAVLNLMKKASSGDKILRGGADHKATEFTAQSCFLLSSVLHATLRGEDRNRIAMLEMHQLPEDVDPLEMELARWRSAGRRLHRRMIEAWPRFERTLAIYKRAIGEQRYTGRWQDTYGVLLACADCLLYDLSPEAADDSMMEPGMSRVKEAVVSILPLLAKSRVEARTDTDRAIAHLLSKSLPGAHGQPPESVGTWLSRAMRTKVVRDEQYPTAEVMSHGPDDAARRKLMTHGMRVVQLITRPDPANPGKTKEGIADALLDEPGWESGYLALAYATNAELQQLWRGTEWAGDGYLQSLRKIPGTVSPKKIRFGSEKADNALLVPLRTFREDEG